MIGPRRRVPLLLGLLALLASACSSPAPKAGGRLQVVAAESPWGAVAAAVGGSEVQVRSVVADPNTDPHEYTPSAAVAAEVATADVVVENGLGYDAFMDQLLSTGAAHGRVVVTAAKVLGVSGTAANPHLWYAVDRVDQVAAAIERAFAAADPSHASDYADNLGRFRSSVAGLEAQLSAIRSRHQGTAVAQTERVAGYLLAEAGLSVRSPASFSQAIESGQEPDASATQSMAQLLAARQVALLVENTQTVSPVTTAAVSEARAAGLPVVGVSELVEPIGASYAAWQSRQISALAAALGGAAP